MLLTCAIGNTHCRFAVFDSSTPVSQTVVPTKVAADASAWASLLDETLRDFPITGAILCSVVPAYTPILMAAIQQFTGNPPLPVTPLSPLGITVHYPEPDRLGADRFVAAFAAWQRYLLPDSDATHALVVDMGTATTFSLIHRAGDFLGGCILPGIGLSIDALFANTAQLQPPEPRTPRSIIATSTEDALRAGIQFGFHAQLAGLVDRFREELGEGAELRVVGTGGAFARLAGHSGFLDVYDPLLTLQGLWLAYAVLNPAGR